MGQSAALAAEVGKGRVYLGHILRLRELAARYGRRIMLWADVLHSYPELVGELPDDVLLLDWQYEAADHYATTDALGKSGRAFWVCPGTSSWNTLFPRLDNALGNIRNLVRDGLAAGASGMLLTDWGDYGHYQPLSASWYPYLFGAGPNRRPVEVRDFHIAITPVTQALWMHVMGSNPAVRHDLRCPVENVSWDHINGAGGFLDRNGEATRTSVRHSLP